MSEQYIQNVAKNIYESCIKLFNERVIDDGLKQVLLKQLEDYYTSTPKNMKYLRSLQFMYENWSRTLPKTQEMPGSKEPIYFFKPHPI